MDSMDSMDRLTFIFSYEHNKPIHFVRTINRGDYETFYIIVSEFFTEELEESHIDAILKIYPEYKNKLLDEDGTYFLTNLRTVFDRDLCSGGCTGISDNTYRIEWST